MVWTLLITYSWCNSTCSAILCISCRLAAWSRVMFRVRLIPFLCYFIKRPITSGFHFFFLMLAALDVQCLDPLIHWRLQNRYILILFLFLFIHWNNFMGSPFPSFTIWLPGSTIHIKKSKESVIWFFLLIYPVFRVMNWFPAILREIQI